MRLVAAAVAVAVAVAGATGPSAAGELGGAAVRPAPSRQYVDALYGLFLDRAPTVAELDAGSAMVHRGPRSALTHRLASSGEWAGDRVDELYRTVLHRPADPAGRAHWVSAIQRGGRLEDVASRFFGGAELYRRIGSTGAFVDSLYDHFLGRPADPGGRSYWLGQLDSGVSRHAVARAFHASPESRRNRVTARYREVLDRDPDPSGHRHWAEALLRIGDVDLAAALAASAEFYARSTGLPPPDVALAPVGGGTAYPLTHSWRPGCPVAPGDLVAVEFSHHRDDRSTTRGVLIVHREVAGDVATAVRAMYGLGFPLTAARPVDDFGGDDERSMDADNSSAFNCRTVAGTGTWSEHAYGRAVDLNPRRNPFVSRSGVDPDSGAGWVDRDRVRPGMVVDDGPVVELFLGLGWGWGGDWQGSKDFQHFSTTGR